MNALEKVLDVTPDEFTIIDTLSTRVLEMLEEGRSLNQIDIYINNHNSREAIKYIARSNVIRYGMLKCIPTVVPNKDITRAIKGIAHLHLVK